MRVFFHLSCARKSEEGRGGILEAALRGVLFCEQIYFNLHIEDSFTKKR